MVKCSGIIDLCVKVSNPLFMKFKLNNVTSLTAARWAAAEGFDYISFNFDKSNINYIQPMMVAEICKWVTGIKCIGKFINTEPYVILDLYRLLNLDGVEIDLKTAENLLLDNSIPVIIQLDINTIQKGVEFRKIKNNILAFSWNDKEVVPLNFPLENGFISSKNNAVNNGKNIPFGIDFNASNETEPGLIDFEELENLINYWKNS